MNPADFGTFQQAIALAQAGRRVRAYFQLVPLSRIYPNYVPLILWIAYTTPELAEARRAIDHAARLEPENPNLANARAYVNHWQAQVISAGPQPAVRKVPVWVKAVGLAISIQLGIALLSIVVLVVLGPQIQGTVYSVAGKATPGKCCGDYTFYSDPTAIRKQAAIGSRAKFETSQLEPAQIFDSSYNYYLWQSKSNTEPGTGVVLKFSKSSGLKPASGLATYYVVVSSRLANSVRADAYLYVEVLEVWK